MPGFYPIAPLFQRPRHQLRALSVQTRWEVTRRHPSYLLYWRNINPSIIDLNLSESEVSALAEMLSAFRESCLSAIGVSGPLPDPKLNFAEIEGDLAKSAWLSGAVHPITMRGLASLLVSALPKDALAQVGYWMVTAGCEDEQGKLPKKSEALQAIKKLDFECLDGYLDEPFVWINSAVSAKQIEADLSSLVKQWKSDAGLTDKRNHSAKHPEYLEVWDLREGWHAGSYPPEKEHLIKDIAKLKQKSVQTIETQYESAFELITGHPFSADNWFTVMAPIKFNRFVRGQGVATANRRLNPQLKRDVPDSVLQPSSSDLSIIGQAAFTEYQGGSEEQLVLKIRRLLLEGKSDTEIHKLLEFDKDKSIDAIKCIRDRINEKLFK